MTQCSKWAENIVQMGTPFKGAFSFKYHPWGREMHDSNARKNVGQKAAQMGYTVAMMNRAFWTIDMKQESVLYLLPTKTPDATDFSSTRFDPALEMSPHLENMFSDVKNVGTKRAGSAVLYIRGSNSRAGLKSIPVAKIFFDEVDEMNQDNIPLAIERMSGQMNKQEWYISTPTLPGFGINKEYLASTQEHFIFPCPSCSKAIELVHENLVITGEDVIDTNIKNSFIQCLECKTPLTNPEDDAWAYANRKADMLINSIWVPQQKVDTRGFYVNQLYSPTVTPHELAKAYLTSLTNKSSEQEYHNSKMGDAHEVEGARISREMIDACIKYPSRLEGAVPDTIMTMGVDVGRWLHYEVTSYAVTRFGRDINVMSDARLVAEGKVAEFHELDYLMRKFQIMQCVIDANPERRKATEFAKRFMGFVKICFYAKGITSKSIGTDESEFKISVDRTSWIDMGLGRFHNKSITLNQDTSQEYRSHIQNIARVYEEDKDGNQVGRYVKNGDDHFAHARTYSEIALPLAAMKFTGHTDIGTFL